MMQWTIERGWCRFWMNEGVRLESSNNHLDIVLRSDGIESEVPLHICVPPILNQVRSLWRTSAEQDVFIECAEEHGLLSLCDGDEGDANVHVTIIGGIGGDCVLGAADIVVHDAHVFSVREDNNRRVARCLGDAELSGTHVSIRAIASPAMLCRMLTTCAARTLQHVDHTWSRSHLPSLTFAYDGRSDKFVVHGVASRPSIYVRILPTQLARICGLSTSPLHFRTTSAQWPSESTLLWDFVEIPVGYYGPCHRPMCLGQPLRFSSEVEMSVNRLYFPLINSSTTSSNSAFQAHLLVFSEPGGSIMTCEIPAGRYSPSSLCAHLENEMSRQVQQLDPSVTFCVHYDNECRFIFSCERKRGGGAGVYAGATFGLYFNHPLSIDSARLGFPPQPLTGACAYTSSECRVISVDRTSRQCGRNIIRVSEITTQKRFRFHCTSVSTMVAVYKRMNGVCGNMHSLSFDTYVNGNVFAHGLQVGDIIRVRGGRCSTIEINSGGDVRSIHESVTTFEEASFIVSASDISNPCTFGIDVPSAWQLDREGTFMRIIVDLEPWNMHFGKPQSIPAQLVGFPPTSVLWNEDGSIQNEHGSLLPPFDAPYSYFLDHPDYILITFSESSGVGFLHSYNGEHKQIFCKISLYPHFREERMLPRDTFLMQGGHKKFSISFWNPDMRTPYCFHGVNFSFSLSFVSQPEKDTHE